MMGTLEAIWPHVAAVLTVLVSVVASGHVVLYKRDVRAAAGWFGLIWLVPLVGAGLYLLLGINRIQRKATALLGERPRAEPPHEPVRLPGAGLGEVIAEEEAHLIDLVRVVNRVARRPLVAGNHIEPLIDGDEAYPAMLEAIASAERSITLCTYIFDNDVAGLAFADALEAAVGRGVEVRVLIDAVGTRYSFPPMDRVLRRRGIRTARFMPTVLPWRMPYFNLRNHRKSMVVDGRLAFTGGMNIRAGCWFSRDGGHPTRDLHFRVEGPVVAHLQETFLEDWAFTTGERLMGEAFLPAQVSPEGAHAIARAIVDGPDEDIHMLQWTLFGALAAARRSIRIVTPYFLPDQALISALCLAAMRGVQVDILLPERGNLRTVQWASTALLWQVLEGGCRVVLTPPPFDHAKLLVVDGAWVLLGSANWDPRSLRLNFELNVEVYDHSLAARMDALVDARMAEGRVLTLEDVDARPLPVRLRDGLCRLLSPYL
jgi:cardiolipin synthase A/B